MAEEVRTAVIGAGSWGTALATVLARQGVDVTLWAREPEVVDGIRSRRRNPLFLADVDLPATLGATGDLDEALRGVDLVVNAVPTQHIRRVLVGAAADRLGRVPIVVTVSKGVEADTLLLPHEILAGIGVAPERVVALSGPSFAREVALDQPTAVVAAGADRERSVIVRDLFGGRRFRVYSSDDIASVELGGALKNVIAIAAGIVDGLGYGHNTMAALISRGLAEVTRLGVARGGDPLTFAGLSGVGDLVLTCTGGLSRNRSVGRELGRGRSWSEISAEMHEVAEGVHTCRSARELGRRAGVELPITEEVCRVIFEGKDPGAAVGDLIGRDLRDERETASAAALGALAALTASEVRTTAG